MTFPRRPKRGTVRLNRIADNDDADTPLRHDLRDVAADVGDEVDGNNQHDDELPDGMQPWDGDSSLEDDD